MEIAKSISVLKAFCEAFSQEPSEFKDLQVGVAVSFLMTLLIVDQLRFCISGAAEASCLLLLLSLHRSVLDFLPTR